MEETKLDHILEKIISANFDSMDNLLESQNNLFLDEIGAFLEQVITLWQKNEITLAAMNTALKFAHKYLDQPDIQIKFKNRTPLPICYFSSFQILAGSFLYSSLKSLSFNVKLFSLNETDKLLKEFIEKREAEKKLKEIDQIRKDLITRTSHELKTPLVSICSSAELLLNIHKKHYDDKAKELIEIIDRGGKRLINLVDTMLDITIIESGHLKLKKRKENLVEIIKYCVDEMTYYAKTRELSLNIDLPKESYLEVDKIRIEGVIINLLTNAIKNTPAKGEIQVNLQENENNISISIIDTGIGLTEREKSRLFKKFGKIERYGKSLDVDIDGSGLGLYICKEIVTLHNGQIWAESEGRNKGSTFTIKLIKN